MHSGGFAMLFSSLLSLIPFPYRTHLTLNRLLVHILSLSFTIDRNVLLPHAHAQGVKRYVRRPSVVCKNILQADTSSTYNRVISFSNSPILTFVYLIIRNTLNSLYFQVFLIIRCSWSSILRYRLQVTFSVTFSVLSVVMDQRAG